MSSGFIEEMFGENVDRLGQFHTNATFAIFEQVSWEIFCKMNFSWYPLDEQVLIHIKIKKNLNQLLFQLRRNITFKDLLDNNYC